MNASIEPNNARSEERLIAFIHALIAAVLHEHQPSAIAALPAVCSQRSPYAISLNAAFAQENQFNMTRPCRVPKGEQLSCILFVLRAEIVAGADHAPRRRAPARAGGAGDHRRALSRPQGLRRPARVARRSEEASLEDALEGLISAQRAGHLLAGPAPASYRPVVL